MTEPQAAGSVAGFARPRPVGAALGLYLLQVLAMVVGVVASFSSLGPMLESAGSASRRVLETRPSHGLTASDLTSITAVFIIVSAIFSLLYLVAYVVLVAFIARGANWARIVLLVLGCFAAVRLIASPFVGALAGPAADRPAQ